MKKGTAVNLTPARAASAAPSRFVLRALLFALCPLLFTYVHAAVPKTGAPYELSDDFAAGAAGSVDLKGGNVVLSGSVGQVAASSASAAGKEVESGYFSKYVSSPSALNYSGISPSSAAVTGAEAVYPNPSSTVYEIETSSVSNFSGSVISASTTAWPVPIAGLAGNTTYYTRIRASYLGMDQSAYGVSEFLTLPATPIPSGFTSVFYSSLTVAWNYNGNSPETMYFAQVGADPGFTVGAFATTSASSHTFEGLAPNTTYFVRLKAIGSLGDETVYSLFGSTMTTAVNPSTSVPCAVSSNTVTVYWDYNGNPYGTRYLAQVSTDNFLTVLAATETVNDYAQFTGLTPDTTHYLRAASLNASGTASLFTALPGALTNAAAPLKQADTFPAVGAFSVTLQWLSNTNPPQTEYRAEISTAANFSGAAVIAPGWAAGASATAGAREPVTVYYFRVKARNSAGIETVYENLGSTRTIYGLDVSSPVITNRQTGDAVWRSSNSAVYNIDLADSGGSYLDKIRVKASSGPGGTGTAAFDWSDAVTGLGANSYTANWGLTSAQWALLGPGTSYISVRAYDTAGNYAELGDAFYIQKDTAAPVITDNQPGEFSWRQTDPGPVYMVDFADGVSGLAAVEYSAAYAPGTASGNILGWTAVTGLTPGATYYSAPWALDFSLLASGSTNYISVRARDLAGGVAQLTDAFLVLKNSGGPDVHIAAPYATYHSTLTAISGTAAQVADYAIIGTELTVQHKGTGLYWDGAAFASSARVWLKASGLADWSYDASLIPWVSSAAYQVVARSSDTALNYSAPYATATFTFDASLPAVVISTPASGAAAETPVFMAGTAQDAAPDAGVPYVTLTLQRKADLKWWNFFTGAWTASPVSTVTAGGAAWSYYPDDALKGSLFNGATYYLYAAAVDGAVPPNASPAGLYASTFTVADTTPPGVVTSTSGAAGRLPGRLDLAWVSSGDDGPSAMLAAGFYGMAYSTDPAAALSTASLQVLFSTGGVMPGSAQAYTVEGLTPGVTYYLRIWVQDEAELWSGPSALITSRSGRSLSDTISGNVRTPSRHGVTGVIVEAIDHDLGVAKTAYTLDDGSGSFTLGGLAVGIYRVQATWVDNGFVSSIAADQIPTGYAEVDFELSVDYELASIGGELTGYRVEAAGYKVRAQGSVVVELYQRNRLVAVAPVGAGGRFLIKNLLPGTYTLKVPDVSGGHKEMVVKLRPGEDLRISAVGELLSDENVYAYPNPARRSVTFHVESAYPHITKQVTVFDITGRAIKEFNDGDFTASGSVYEAVWNIPSGVASGVYIYSARVKSEDTGEYKKTVKKFAIVK